MPKHVKVNFVATEEDALNMAMRLVNSDFIGVDSEWRPAIAKQDKSKPALLQLSNRKEAFLVDLVSLLDNPVLDKVLSDIF
jgi:hypothetical protein